MTDFSKLSDKEIDLMFKLNLDKKKESYDLLRNLSKTDEKDEKLDEQIDEDEETDEKDGSSEEETTE